MDKWRNRQAYIPVGTAYYSSQHQLHIHYIETPAKFIAHLLETGNFFESHTAMKGYTALVFCRYAGYERMTTAGLATCLYQVFISLEPAPCPVCCASRYIVTSQVCE